MNQPKLDPTKSRFAQKQEQKAKFEESVAQATSSAEEKKEKAAKLSTMFMEMIKSSVLAENKGPMLLSTETETLKNLIEFAIQLNNDPLEPEGQGSVALNAIALKSLLHLRDRINSLSYAIEQLKKADKSAQ